MNATDAARDLLSNPAFRFTIRQIGKGDLRKRMTASRFLATRGGYVGRVGMRVDVVNTETGSVQTWDLGLTKVFWA